jgi:exodeoxyribonuclease V alpha subunit
MTRDGAAAESGIEPIDRALADVLLRHSRATGEDATLVAAAAQELSAARSLGHSALRIDAHPDGRAWAAALARTGVAGPFDAGCPLVATDDLLQFRRYAAAERRIAQRVRQRIGTEYPRLRIITGGPGSGKTTYIARYLVDRVTAEPSLRIALAAPTGKAAARLTESIRARLDTAGADADLRARIPSDARTVHRLLGYRHVDDSFRYTANRTLDADLVIIDEASMLDVLLTDALLDALRDDTELLLVGDHHQLTSVEAGDILGSLVQHPALVAAVKTLDGNYRFQTQPGIASIATAIRAGRVDEALTLLDDGQHPDAQHIAGSDTDAVLLNPLLARLEACLTADSPQALLAALEGLRILCAERRGRLAVEGMNAMVERWLARRGVTVQDRWYHRRPVLVGANDYGTGVFNGDLGVCWHEGGETLVHFPNGESGTRSLAPERLPSVSTAWAMTVHKAQGSEFDEVLLVLPRKESRILSRELVYTGITRARKKVTVVGTTERIRAALVRTAARSSGLGGALGA